MFTTLMPLDWQKSHMYLNQKKIKLFCEDGLLFQSIIFYIHLQTRLEGTFEAALSIVFHSNK